MNALKDPENTRKHGPENTRKQNMFSGVFRTMKNKHWHEMQ